ncbi:hypothetical protein QEV83_14455 [Methylocapsa sp. D3K7]|uniref:hypothetical protein n=1 Tax=Methylocapsa sp. D3K7 TaxID=3041435 RepID=UPI00244E8D75|nr:hypothetical protein [Methylocapsa sp. D3K7]WGJ13863.1 hypothetical protein QEV83_14455 [Methylocapsa sp. D3K7]
MKAIDSNRKKLIIEFDAEDWTLIGCLFSIISTDTGVPTPWWATENGTDELVMNEEKFDELWRRWSALTDAPEANAFFVGKDR